MSVVIESKIERYILDAPRGDVRIAANRLSGSDPERPALVMLMTTEGAVVLLEVLAKAIEHAPDPETAGHWKELGRRLSEAINGVMQ